MYILYFCQKQSLYECLRGSLGSGHLADSVGAQRLRMTFEVCVSLKESNHYIYPNILSWWYE